MMKHLIAGLIGFLILQCCAAAFSQTVHNPKNVDRTAMTYYSGMQTFRALEYTVNPSPQSQKLYRLETLAENGFPPIWLSGTFNGNSVTFEDKAPYDNVFTDNSTPYLSTEVVQLHYGFQAAMKVFNQRFGWKGMDNIGIDPVAVYVENSDETQQKTYSYAYYSGDINNKFFAFGKSFKENTPLPISIDVIAHELSHAVMQHRSNITFHKSSCSEQRSIDEGLADVFGVYVENILLQSTPQNYNWLVKEEFLPTPNDIRAPKSYGRADTYKGQNFDNGCSANYNYNAGAGVITKWFYLLSSGFAGTATNDLGYQYGNLTGIGIEKSIQIIWDAIPNLKNYSTFPAFKTLTLNAAKQLYGTNSPEYQAVEKAWCAVGVCDNNLPFFTIYPPNASSDIEPWPKVKVNFSWDNDPRVKEIEVLMASDHAFTNPQAYKVSSFETFFKSGGGTFYKGSASGYFRPGETVYVKARITQADPNFCKGLNPLCKIYQQFGPTHAFELSDKKVKFWPATTSTTVKPWYGELTWQSVKDAELYLMQVASDASFNTIIYEGFAPHTGNFTEIGLINATLDIGQTYYARVRAKRLDKPQLQDNHGAWSNALTIKTSMPSTAITQAKTQKPNDPPLLVSSLGRVINWDPVPGADGFIVEVAKDPAYNDIVSSETVSGNSASKILIFPPLPDQTNLFVRVRPKKGLAIGVCSDDLRIKINATTALPVMKSPADGTTFPFKNFAATGFGWGSGTLNMNTVHHFELHIAKDGAGSAAIFTTPGKDLQLFVQDPLIFNAKSLKVSALAVNELGAKTALSQAFIYPICPDHPAVFFPGDLGKVDATKNFQVQWHSSESFVSGSQYLVTIKENGSIAVPGFSDKPTTANSMLVPAGTLANGKNYTVTVRNSSSCPAILLPTTFFSAIGPGSVNQPQQPKLVNFNIEIKGFRNDPDAFSVPPAFGTSNYDLGIELFDPNGAPLALLDPNMMPVNKLAVDSENSGVVMIGSNKPQGKYKLRLKLDKIYAPNTYYPLDQPRFSVFLNGQTILLNHIITFDIFNPGSSFDEWKEGFQFSDIILDIK